MRDPKGGVDDLDAAIHLDSANATYYYNRAYFKMDLNKFQDAIPDLDRAISLNPNYPDAYFENDWASQGFKYI